jgi:RNase H-like protein
LDVESVPDQDFYYLIGVRIFKNDSSVQHSLWADTRQDERKIWTEFLQVLAGVEDPVLIHYGSFEAKFIKLMRERYPETAASDVRLDRVLKESVNLLEFIYGQVFPDVLERPKGDRRVPGIQLARPRRDRRIFSYMASPMGRIDDASSGAKAPHIQLRRL